MFEAHVWAEAARPNLPPSSSYSLVWHDTTKCCLPHDFVKAQYPLLLIKFDGKLAGSISFKSYKDLISNLDKIMQKYT